MVRKIIFSLISFVLIMALLCVSAYAATVGTDLRLIQRQPITNPTSTQISASNSSAAQGWSAALRAYAAASGYTLSHYERTTTNGTKDTLPRVNQGNTSFYWGTSDGSALTTDQFVVVMTYHITWTQFATTGYATYGWIDTTVPLQSFSGAWAAGTYIGQYTINVYPTITQEPDMVTFLEWDNPNSQYEEYLYYPIFAPVVAETEAEVLQLVQDMRGAMQALGDSLAEKVDTLVVWN